MTSSMQIALETTVLGMGTKFFSSVTTEVLTVTIDLSIAAILEILIGTGMGLLLLQSSMRPQRTLLVTCHRRASR